MDRDRQGKALTNVVAKLPSQKINQTTTVSTPRPLQQQSTVKDNKLNVCQDNSKREEYVHLLSIFPMEIWSMVAEGLNTHKDLRALYNSSMFFRNLLMPEAVQLLFDDVWAILEKHYFQNSASDKLGITFSDFLSMRLVCRSWEQAIENSCRVHSFDHQNNNPFKQRIIANFSEDSPECMQKFLQHFDGTHKVIGERSPFVGKSINISIGFGYHDFRRSAQLAARYLAELQMLLLLYGDHISNCTLTFYHEFPFWTTVYRHVTTLLSLMPNLKILDIRFLAVLIHEDGRRENSVEPAPCPTLEQIEIISSYKLPQWILNQIILSNSHVMRMDLRSSEKHCDYDFHRYSFPNLKEVSMEICSYSDFTKLGLYKLKWKLSKLELSFNDSGPNSFFVEWTLLFDLLERNWKDTLTDLKLSLPKAVGVHDKQKILQHCSMYKLNLPHLKRLNLTVRNACLLEFILPIMDSLEVFELCYDVELCDEDKRSMFKSRKRCALELLDFMETERLLESNIWRIFTELQYFSCVWWKGPRVCQSFHTRGEWRNAMRKKGRAICSK